MYTPAAMPVILYTKNINLHIIPAALCLFLYRCVDTDSCNRQIFLKNNERKKVMQIL